MQWDKGRHWHKAYDKNPRLGGRHIGMIYLTCRPYVERYCDMPVSDLEAEGGLWDTVEDYIGKRDPQQECCVLRFRFHSLEEYESIKT